MKDQKNQPTIRITFFVPDRLLVMLHYERLLYNETSFVNSCNQYIRREFAENIHVIDPRFSNLFQLLDVSQL